MNTPRDHEPWTTPAGGMRRAHVTSGTAWEERNGYARCVRVGPFVHAAGTLGTNDAGEIEHPHSAKRQTLDALAKIERAMARLGAHRRHVMRTRLYIIREHDADEVGAAHAEFFAAADSDSRAAADPVRPACTLLTIKALADPLALVEVELDAIVHDEPRAAADHSRRPTRAAYDAD